MVNVTFVWVFLKSIWFFDYFTAIPFCHAQHDEDVDAVVDAVAEPNSGERRDRKRKRMLRELDSLKADNAGKVERDRMALWRKMQKFISRNDDIATEYVYFYLFTFR